MDKQTKALLEVMNHIILKGEFDQENVITTDVLEANVLTTAQDKVQKDIEHFRQRKASIKKNERQAMSCKARIVMRTKFISPGDKRFNGAIRYLDKEQSKRINNLDKYYGIELMAGPKNTQTNLCLVQWLPRLFGCSAPE